MNVMLTSALGGSNKVNGTRVPSVLIQHNGLLDNLKSIWKQNANVLIICADPSDYDKNDSVCDCLRTSPCIRTFKTSGWIRSTRLI